MIFYAMNYYKFREFSFRKKYLQKKKSKCFNFKIKHFSNHYTALALHFKEVKKWLPPSSILICIFFPFLPSDCQRCKRNSARVCVRVHQLHHQRVSFLKTAYFWRGGILIIHVSCLTCTFNILSYFFCWFCEIWCYHWKKIKDNSYIWRQENNKDIFYQNIFYGIQ